MTNNGIQNQSHGPSLLNWYRSANQLTKETPQKTQKNIEEITGQKHDLLSAAAYDKWNRSKLFDQQGDLKEISTFEKVFANRDLEFLAKISNFLSTLPESNPYGNTPSHILKQAGATAETPKELWKRMEALADLINKGLKISPKNLKTVLAKASTSEAASKTSPLEKAIRKKALKFTGDRLDVVTLVKKSLKQIKPYVDLKELNKNIKGLLVTVISLLAQTEKESSLRQEAISGQGAFGFRQMMPHAFIANAIGKYKMPGKLRESNPKLNALLSKFDEMPYYNRIENGKIKPIIGKKNINRRLVQQLKSEQLTFPCVIQLNDYTEFLLRDSGDLDTIQKQAPNGFPNSWVIGYCQNIIADKNSPYASMVDPEINMLTGIWFLLNDKKGDFGLYFGADPSQQKTYENGIAKIMKSYEATIPVIQPKRRKPDNLKQQIAATTPNKTDKQAIPIKLAKYKKPKQVKIAGLYHPTKAVPTKYGVIQKKYKSIFGLANHIKKELEKKGETFDRLKIQKKIMTASNLNKETIKEMTSNTTIIIPSLKQLKKA